MPIVYTDGFDVPRVSQDFATNYSSSGGIKSYAPGVAISSHTVDMGIPYVSSAAPKAFSSGFAVVFQTLTAGTIYMGDFYRYKLFTQGAVEASTLSRLLRPGDNGIDVSWLNMDEQKQSIFVSY